MTELNYENLINLASEYVKERPISSAFLYTDFFEWFRLRESHLTTNAVDLTAPASKREFCVCGYENCLCDGIKLPRR